MAEISGLPTWWSLRCTHSLGSPQDHDFDKMMDFYAPDGVWDMADLGLGTFEGAAAFRGFAEDWWRTFQDQVIKVEEIVDLGHGVVFCSVRESGRLAYSAGARRTSSAVGAISSVQGSRSRLALRSTSTWNEARAAAERLAEERGRRCRTRMSRISV